MSNLLGSNSNSLRACGPPIMSDEEYRLLLESLGQRDVGNPSETTAITTDVYDVSLYEDL